MPRVSPRQPLCRRYAPTPLDREKSGSGGPHHPCANIDTQALANGTEYCGKIVHAWIAALRQHPVQALAGCIGLGGEFFKANGGVHKVSQNEPGGVWIAIKK